MRLSACSPDAEYATPSIIAGYRGKPKRKGYRTAVYTRPGGAGVLSLGSCARVTVLTAVRVFSLIFRFSDLRLVELLFFGLVSFVIADNRLDRNRDSNMVRVFTDNFT